MLIKTKCSRANETLIFYSGADEKKNDEKLNDTHVRDANAKLSVSRERLDAVFQGKPLKHNKVTQ